MVYRLEIRAPEGDRSNCEEYVIFRKPRWKETKTNEERGVLKVPMTSFSEDVVTLCK